jgi:hypothetical protein
VKGLYNAMSYFRQDLSLTSSVSIVFDFATGTRSGQEPSYVRKNSQMASFAKNKMPNTTGKSYARKRNSTVHQ